ncbi:MAG: hypothetical protein OEZ45_09190 [Candidatus Aminicenantes bacterium]|nr:hypothetical protein [Candidatus Aminicenantes bacterium]MDH5706181.1 hypothetical protein [Candidatus Aminicenantes bacterium]
MCRSKDKEDGAKFELRFYSGYKGKEIPRAVVIGGREFVIEEVVSQKRVLDQKTGKRFEVFDCRMEGQRVKIKHFESGEWEISFPEET